MRSPLHGRIWVPRLRARTLGCPSAEKFENLCRREMCPLHLTPGSFNASGASPQEQHSAALGTHLQMGNRSAQRKLTQTRGETCREREREGERERDKERERRDGGRERGRMREMEKERERDNLTRKDGGKLGEERLKEMEAEMALFEQEVLGGPVPGGPAVMEAMPMALAMPMVRPIIGTNTYQQVQQTLDARAAGFVGPPGPAFVTPVRAPPPMMRPAFVPHILQRPGTRLPVAPPLPRPPPPPPMMVPPPLQNPAQLPQVSQPIQTLQHMSVPAAGVGDMMSPVGESSLSPAVSSSTPVIQAAPTVYSAPPATIVRKPERTQRQARMVTTAAHAPDAPHALSGVGLAWRTWEQSIAELGKLSSP
ncbi:hypothetical protein WMY93_026311 [Mugilogobius chulae]|uniref:Uncharacterized protein n=1 Tax=Mugilogobius chulae TaxID=88201 RepID=A0AAW0N2U6_9GOBI